MALNITYEELKRRLDNIDSRLNARLGDRGQSVSKNMFGEIVALIVGTSEYEKINPEDLKRFVDKIKSFISNNYSISKNEKDKYLRTLNNISSRLIEIRKNNLFSNFSGFKLEFSSSDNLELTVDNPIENLGGGVSNTSQVSVDEGTYTGVTVTELITKDYYELFKNRLDNMNLEILTYNKTQVSNGANIGSNEIYKLYLDICELVTGSRKAVNRNSLFSFLSNIKDSDNLLSRDPKYKDLLETIKDLVNAYPNSSIYKSSSRIDVASLMEGKLLESVQSNHFNEQAGDGASVLEFDNNSLSNVFEKTNAAVLEQEVSNSNDSKVNLSMPLSSIMQRLEGCIHSNLNGILGDKAKTVSEEMYAEIVKLIVGTCEYKIVSLSDLIIVVGELKKIISNDFSIPLEKRNKYGKIIDNISSRLREAQKRGMFSKFFGSNLLISDGKSSRVVEEGGFQYYKQVCEKAGKLIECYANGGENPYQELQNFWVSLPSEFKDDFRNYCFAQFKPKNNQESDFSSEFRNPIESDKLENHIVKLPPVLSLDDDNEFSQGSEFNDSEMKVNKTIWSNAMKKIAPWALGSVAGLVASCVPGVGVIRMHVSLAKLLGSAGIKIVTKVAPGKIDDIVNKYTGLAGHKFPGITAKVNKVRKFLQTPMWRGLTNGFAAGYLAGNMFEVLAGESVLDFVSEKFNSSESLETPLPGSTLPADQNVSIDNNQNNNTIDKLPINSNALNNRNPINDFMEISSALPNADTITEILEEGVKYDLTALEKVCDSPWDSYEKIGEKLKECWKGVTLGEIKVVDGVEWTQIIGRDGLTPIGWAKTSDFVAIADKIVKVSGRSL